MLLFWWCYVLYRALWLVRIFTIYLRSIQWDCLFYVARSAELCDCEDIHNLLVKHLMRLFVLCCRECGALWLVRIFTIYLWSIQWDFLFNVAGSADLSDWWGYSQFTCVASNEIVCFILQGVRSSVIGQDIHNLLSNHPMRLFVLCCRECEALWLPRRCTTRASWTISWGASGRPGRNPPAPASEIRLEDIQILAGILSFWGNLDLAKQIFGEKFHFRNYGIIFGFTLEYVIHSFLS